MTGAASSFSVVGFYDDDDSSDPEVVDVGPDD